MVPRSLWLVLPAFGLWLLLALPPISIILAMFGFMFVPAIMLNMAVIGAACEAWTGLAGRGWLLLPLIWFGLFAGLATLDRAKIRQLRAQVEAHNAGLAIPFDRDAEALVFVSGQRTEEFVTTYALRAFESADQRSLTKVRLGEGLVCDRTIEPPSGTLRHWITDERQQRSRRHQLLDLIPERCILTERDAATTLPQLKVFARERTERTSTGFSKIHLRDQIVQRPEGTRYIVRGGSAEPMSFFPIPLFGCYPNGSQWTCEGTMWGSDAINLSGKSEPFGGTPLGGALGLTPVELPRAPR